MSRRRAVRESAGEARRPRDGRSTAPQGHPHQTTRANRPPAPQSPGLPQTSMQAPPPPAVRRGSPAARVCCARATATSGARAARGAPSRGPAALATPAEARPTPRAPAALPPHFSCDCCLQILGTPETRGSRAAAIAAALLGAGGSAAAAGRRHARSLQLVPARSSLKAQRSTNERRAGALPGALQRTTLCATHESPLPWGGHFQRTRTRVQSAWPRAYAGGGPWLIEDLGVRSFGLPIDGGWWEAAADDAFP